MFRTNVGDSFKHAMDAIIHSAGGARVRYCAFTLRRPASARRGARQNGRRALGAQVHDAAANRRSTRRRASAPHEDERAPETMTDMRPLA